MQGLQEQGNHRCPLVGVACLYFFGMEPDVAVKEVVRQGFVYGFLFQATWLGQQPAEFGQRIVTQLQAFRDACQLRRIEVQPEQEAVAGELVDNPPQVFGAFFRIGQAGDFPALQAGNDQAAGLRFVQTPDILVLQIFVDTAVVRIDIGNILEKNFLLDVGMHL